MLEPAQLNRGGYAATFTDRLIAALLWAMAAVVCGLFVWILFDIIRHGVSEWSLALIWESPSNAGRDGGIASILVATALIMLVCMAVSLPVGLATAVLLSEFARSDARLGRWVRRSLDVLAAVPSIVFGLFGNAFFCIYLGLGYSVLSGGLTLACMVLPLLIRSLEASLRAVPDDYRLACAGLGLTQAASLRYVLLPVALPGLVVGFVLALSRALAETAALLFTSGYVDRMPESLSDSGRALAVHIFDLAMHVPGGEPRAYASAFVLMICLLAINALTVLLSARWRQRSLAL